MRTWPYAAVVGLAALGFGMSHADTVITPKPKGGFDQYRAKPEIAVKPSTAIKPRVTITSFSARRNGANIETAAWVKSFGGVVNAAPTVTGTWTLYRQEGSKWQVFKTGRISANGQQYKIGNTFGSPAAGRFKFEVRADGTNFVAASKPVAVPQMVYLVKYRLMEWKVKSGKSSDLLGAKWNSLRYADDYRKLGFEVTSKYTYHERVFQSNYFTWDVTYRCVTWQERTFPTSGAAANFLNSLPPFTDKRLSSK